MAYSKTFLLLSLITVFALLISSEVAAARLRSDHTGEESLQKGNPIPKIGADHDHHSHNKNCGKYSNSPCHGGGHHPGHGGHHPQTIAETNGK